MKQLLNKGQRQGYVTLEDVARVLKLNSTKDSDEVYEILESADIDVYSPDEISRTQLKGVDVDDSISMYLKEISQVPLLTTQEEVALARKIERGKDAASELSPSLGNEQRDKLAEDIKLGKQARQQIIDANCRLVVSIAKRYTGRGVSFLDLIK
jgi:RNA polymerase primary sigma factor